MISENIFLFFRSTLIPQQRKNIKSIPYLHIIPPSIRHEKERKGPINTLKVKSPASIGRGLKIKSPHATFEAFWEYNRLLANVMFFVRDVDNKHDKYMFYFCLSISWFFIFRIKIHIPIISGKYAKPIWAPLWVSQ